MDDSVLEEMEKETLAQLKALEDGDKDDKESEDVVEEALKEAKEPKEEEQQEEDLGEAEESEEEAPFDEKSAQGKAFQKMRKQLKTQEELLTRTQEEKDKERNEKETYLQRLSKLEGAHEANQLHQASRQEEDLAPDRTMDPDAWLDWKDNQREKESQGLKNEIAQLKQSQILSDARRELQSIENHYAVSNNINDYQQRKQHIKDRQTELLKLQNPTLKPDQVDRLLDLEELKVAYQTYNSGQNPADVFYKMSQQYGYVEQKPANTEEKTVTRKSSEAGRTEPNLDKIRRNKEKTVSLNGGSSRGKMDGPTAEEMADMSISQLAALSDAEIKAATKELTMTPYEEY